MSFQPHLYILPKVKSLNIVSPIVDCVGAFYSYFFNINLIYFIKGSYLDNREIIITHNVFYIVVSSIFGCNQIGVISSS